MGRVQPRIVTAATIVKATLSDLTRGVGLRAETQVIFAPSWLARAIAAHHSPLSPTAAVITQGVFAYLADTGLLMAWLGQGTGSPMLSSATCRRGNQGRRY